MPERHHDSRALSRFVCAALRPAGAPLSAPTAAMLNPEYLTVSGVRPEPGNLGS